jgi:ligand-binding sensor domain-containing protein
MATQEMTKYCIHQPINFLLFVLIFLGSCKGQNKSQIESVNPTKIITSGNPKMIRTQGTNYTQVGCRFQDKAGNLWFGTLNEGVYRYDGKNFKNFTDKDGLVNNEVWFVLEDKNGNLWIGTRGFGLSRYDGKTFTTVSDYKE